jgi:hypothetical protein
VQREGVGMSGQRRQLGEVYEELGRYWASFSFLDEVLRWLCAALVAPGVAQIGAVVEEVDISRLCTVVLPRAMRESDRVEVQELATRWQRSRGTKSRLLIEIDWRNVVAHSNWSTTFTDSSRMQVIKTRRGATTSVTADLLRARRRAVARVRDEVVEYLDIVEGRAGETEEGR